MCLFTEPIRFTRLLRCSVSSSGGGHLETLQAQDPWHCLGGKMFDFFWAPCIMQGVNRDAGKVSGGNQTLFFPSYYLSSLLHASMLPGGVRDVSLRGLDGICLTERKEQVRFRRVWLMWMSSIEVR